MTLGTSSTPGTSDPRSAPQPPRRSPLRRYAGPVLLGTVLGVGVLVLLSRLAEAPTSPRPTPAEERQARDRAKLAALEPELILTVPAEPAVVGEGERAVPPACPDDAENADCLRATLVSGWRVSVGSGAATGEFETVHAKVGDRLSWQLVSERRGLLSSFLVEEDGAVLSIYPSPSGEMPVVAAGEPHPVPTRGDRSRMTWHRPGPRRIFALVSTTPFVPPAGQAVGSLATYYEAGAPAASFFASLRNQVVQDQEAGVGEWALGEIRLEVE